MFYSFGAIGLDESIVLPSINDIRGQNTIGLTTKSKNSRFFTKFQVVPRALENYMVIKDATEFTPMSPV